MNTRIPTFPNPDLPQKNSSARFKFPFCFLSDFGKQPFFGHFSFISVFSVLYFFALLFRAAPLLFLATGNVLNCWIACGASKSGLNPIFWLTVLTRQTVQTLKLWVFLH
ncbi:hypothetical protein AAK899_08765 [Erysipelotrichaceae bacterium 51-3]